mmetsp:Transcript_13883/g.39309  ORF Transcript_13883/g.39309 Transcript_13883/m.39309 type:complete len:244 (+) Transcript_13883:307-1038(+)
MCDCMCAKQSSQGQWQAGDSTREGEGWDASVLALERHIGNVHVVLLQIGVVGSYHHGAGNLCWALWRQRRKEGLSHRGGAGRQASPCLRAPSRPPRTAHGNSKHHSHSCKGCHAGCMLAPVVLLVHPNPHHLGEVPHRGGALVAWQLLQQARLHRRGGLSVGLRLAKRHGEPVPAAVGSGALSRAPASAILHDTRVGGFGGPLGLHEVLHGRHEAHTGQGAKAELGVLIVVKGLRLLEHGLRS